MLYLRASAFYGASFDPLYRAPVDHRISAGFHKQIAAVDMCPRSDEAVIAARHPDQPLSGPTLNHCHDPTSIVTANCLPGRAQLQDRIRMQELRIPVVLRRSELFGAAVTAANHVADAMTPQACAVVVG